MTRITDAHFRDPSERHGDGHPLATTPEPPVKTELPSPWLQNTLWIAEPSAAPVEYLAPLRELGFTQLCVRVCHGENSLRVYDAMRDYEQHGWSVVAWGRVDQKLGEDVRADPLKAAGAVGSSSMWWPFAANVEIRWDEGDSAIFAATSPHKSDALCTYPGGMPDSAHRYYQQAGVRVILVQTFGRVGDYDHPYTIPMQRAYDWGKSLGYEIVIPQVGVFEYEPTKLYEDAARQAHDLGSLPRHAYLCEQSGWRHISGSGYEWEKLMAGVR